MLSSSYCFTYLQAKICNKIINHKKTIFEGPFFTLEVGSTNKLQALKITQITNANGKKMVSFNILRPSSLIQINKTIVFGQL